MQAEALKRRISGSVQGIQISIINCILYQLVKHKVGLADFSKTGP